MGNAWNILTSLFLPVRKVSLTTTTYSMLIELSIIPGKEVGLKINIK